MKRFLLVLVILGVSYLSMLIPPGRTIGLRCRWVVADDAQHCTIGLVLSPTRGAMHVAVE